MNRSVGTVKKNKRMIPQEFLPNRKRLIDSSEFGFQSDKTIVSYVPKKPKSIILISSMHHDNTVGDDTKKPEIILYYNRTKAGVDALDEKCANYSTSRRSRRWPMAIFHCILNISRVNSRVIYQLAKCVEISRYNFLKQLGMALYTPHMRQRIYNKNVPRKLRSLGADILGVMVHDNPQPGQDNAKRKRYAICPAKKDRKTSTCCAVCNLPICLQCAVKVCENCK
jgi:hypothetical protein